MGTGWPSPEESGRNINKDPFSAAGRIRSAMLWRQCGGSELKILLKQSSSRCQELMGEINAAGQAWKNPEPVVVSGKLNLPSPVCKVDPLFPAINRKP